MSRHKLTTRSHDLVRSRDILTTETQARGARATVILSLMLSLCWLHMPWGARAAEPESEPGLTGRKALEVLKSLVGEWRGSVGQRDGAPGRVLFRVTSGGSAVFERQFPDQPHEMTTVYHLDGEDLVLTHYCAAGNQPRMRLDQARSTPKELIFEFTGGTNLDPKKDGHVHSGRIRVVEGDRFEAEWYFHANGRLAGTNGFFMARSPAPKS